MALLIEDIKDYPDNYEIHVSKSGTVLYVVNPETYEWVLSCINEEEEEDPREEKEYLIKFNWIKLDGTSEVWTYIVLAENTKDAKAVFNVYSTLLRGTKEILDISLKE